MLVKLLKTPFGFFCFLLVLTLFNPPYTLYTSY